MKRLSLAILLSGEGSNLQALIDAIELQQLDASIVAVISDNPQAPGLDRAQKSHIPTHIACDNTQVGRETAMHTAIALYSPDLIVLTGYMRILSVNFVNRYYPIINLHPSLLPQYKGLNTHQRVLEAHEILHGSSVHIVTEGLDDGPVISQATLSVYPHDTAETLKIRIKRLEHRLLPQTLQWLALGKITWNKHTLLWEERPFTQPIRVPIP